MCDEERPRRRGDRCRHPRSRGRSFVRRTAFVRRPPPGGRFSLCIEIEGGICVRRRWDDEDWSEDQPGSVHEEWFEPLSTDGLITEVLMPLKSGKEASVHLCRGGASLGHELVAVKAYHPRERRGFRNDAVYKNGRVILKARDRRAVEKKTAFGRDFDDATWVYREWE